MKASELEDIGLHKWRGVMKQNTTLLDQGILTLMPLDKWKPLFWFGAGPPVLLIILRAFLPETVVYKFQNGAINDRENIRGFLIDFREAVRRHWKLLAYMVAFMAGCTFLVNYSLSYIANLTLTINSPMEVQTYMTSCS
jgi:hypothetical protein